MSGREEAFMRLTDEVRRAFHQLAALAEGLHDEAGLAAGHRGVLESLWRSGEQTVPALARARPVSRQHIQVLVNELIARRWVEARPNPAHRRSPLLGLTTKGRAVFEAMRERERGWLSSARLSVSVLEMDAATETLRRLREHLARAADPK